jgi:radical SAM superfamily enzyme YgiQ (UPF0313 family)
MRILLANPPCRIDLGHDKERFFIRAGSRWPFSIVKEKQERIEYAPFPFYLGYTAALLEEEGFDIHVNDAVTRNQSLEGFIDLTVELKPDLLLYETATPTIHYDLQLAKKLKERLEIIICLAGPHASVYPEEILEQSDRSVDYVLLREYELNFLDLAKRLRDNNDPSGVRGLAFRRGGEVIVTPPEPIEPLDRLPPPARHLFPSNEQTDLNLYWDGFCQYKPAVQMHSSRGCPFRCNFCLWNQVMYANGKYRVFEAGRVVDEMEAVIKSYGAREIYFDDDTFTADKNHVLEICREIKARGVNVHWSCMGDTMMVDEEMIDFMADAGCIGMKFGVESGCEEILRHINKPIKFEKVEKVAEWCADRGIKTHATFTFGLSGETHESMNRTLDLAKRLDVDSVQFSITTPFPGTRYYEELESKGLLKTKAWEKYDGLSTSVAELENVTDDEVSEFCHRASGRWLRHKLQHPKWVWRQMKNLNRLRKGQGNDIILRRFARTIQLLV